MEIKTCIKCHSPKPTVEFSFRNKEKYRLCSWCKSCQKTYKDQHYITNKKEYIAKARKQSDIRRGELQAKMFEYYEIHPCIDCGEKDPVVLQSDHVRGIKALEISTMIANGCKWRVVQRELEKCDTRCANCHSRKTARQQGWYKHVALSSKGKESRPSTD